MRLHSQSIQAIAAEYATRRRQFKKVKLSWRKSGGARRSLRWISFKAAGLSYANGQIRYGKVWLSLWDSYGLSGYALGPGNISEDARGRWYINICATPKQKPVRQLSLFGDSVGIDLGLKDFAAISDGGLIEAQQFYRNLEEQLAIAQCANRKDRVNASALAQTNHAKSVLDVGWSAFRGMLQYKCDDADAWFDEVNEAYSTQTCSCCNKRTGPKGREGLRMREWACSECGTIHHRGMAVSLEESPPFPRKRLPVRAEGGENIKGSVRCRP